MPFSRFCRNCLLPILKKEPGKLYCITGLKLDNIVVVCINDGTTDIYGFVEPLASKNVGNAVLLMILASELTRFICHVSGVAEKNSAIEQK